MQSPFERILGSDFEQLPVPVRRVHALRQPLATAGRADVTAATGFFAWLLCWGAGLPRPGEMDVSVRFNPTEQSGEQWERRFGNRRYASSIAAGTGRDQGFLIEHFGLFDLCFRLTARSDGLVWSLAKWRLFRIPLPRWSRPRIECVESAEGDRFTFDIDVTFPVIGWLIHYRGWLLPQDSGRSVARSSTHQPIGK